MRYEDKLQFFYIKSLVTKRLEEEVPRFVYSDEQLHFIPPECIRLHKRSKIPVPKNPFQTLKCSVSKFYQSNVKVSPLEDTIKYVSKTCTILGKKSFGHLE